MNAEDDTAMICNAFHAATGPKRSVTGNITMAGNVMDVFHMRFAPCGYIIELVKNGVWPWPTAHGVNRRYHMNSSGSAPRPLKTAWCEKRELLNIALARPRNNDSAAR